ncbi:uncharacterized protein [Watersipora subatra]|uniref:uncharacterized protein isoform X2 n=1 Tax=Watersipora subatra TaxID=2589382 RepID=UPI00355C6B79
MDEEVLLEDLDENEFDISAVGVTRDAYTSSATMVDKEQSHVTDGQQKLSFFGIQQAQHCVRSELCQDLLNCPSMSKEYFAVLHSFLECYHSNIEDISSTASSLSRLMIHGALACTCVYLSSRLLKLAALTSWCCHLAIPFCRFAVQNIFTRTLQQNRSRISEILTTFSQALSVLAGVEKFLQELRLISLSSGRSGGSPSANGTENMMGMLTDSAQCYVEDCIANLKPEVKLLRERIDCFLLSNLQLFSEPIPSDQDSVSNSFKRNRKLLRLLISQWIFCLAVFVRGSISTDTLVVQLSSLNGLTSPHQLEKDLKFYKAVLDGDESEQVKVPKKFPSKQDQAIHSLYLHSRELLRLSKLADGGNGFRTEDLFSQISSELRDCSVCFNIASKANKLPDKLGEEGLSVKPFTTPQICQPPSAQPDTVIDQVFVTEEGAVEEEPPASDGYDMEAQLHKEYQVALMRELNGVIHELARERVKRESQLLDSKGLSVDTIAKITQELVQNRDIKTMVKTRMPEENINQPLPSLTERPQQPKKKYGHLDVETSTLNITSEMKHLAEMVAQRFTQQQELEETFGSDSESDS